jgi:hypothetical protein
MKPYVVPDIDSAYLPPHSGAHEASRSHAQGILVDSEIVLSTRYGKAMVFINKTLSTETSYQQDLINRDLRQTVAELRPKID